MSSKYRNHRIIFHVMVGIIEGLTDILLLLKILQIEPATNGKLCKCEDQERDIYEQENSLQK